MPAHLLQETGAALYQESGAFLILLENAVPDVTTLPAGIGGKLHLSDLRDLRLPPRHYHVTPTPAVIVAPVQVTGALRVSVRLRMSGQVVVDQVWRQQREEDEALVIDEDLTL